MYCLVCGNKLSEGSKFCDHCGSKVKAHLNNSVVNTTSISVNAENFEQNARKGITIYLRNLAYLEFIANKLQSEIQSRKTGMLIWESGYFGNAIN